MNQDYKFIHLLYVPTMNCNMACKYCYLKENTVDLSEDDKYLKTLVYAVNKFKKSNVIPFNISLHGGEVTTLSKKDFRNIVEFINNYYKDNKEIIQSNGFRLGEVHIKTNLYNLEKHIDTIKEFNVSISGSLDLPLSLHEEYRTTKGNGKTLERILNNIKLLESIPNKKKVSSTIFKEHYDKTDEIIKDIKFLEKNTCLDMNDFNFMIGFTTPDEKLLHPMTELEQVDFYNRMKEAFKNTTLEKGLKTSWFQEFGPEYCTNCDNCGEKFFLLERSGDIYSCVRGQTNKDFFYGNIYKNTVEEILNNAKKKIFEINQKIGFNDKCSKCKYLYLCKTGCPYVKNNYKINTSYTCLLQQELYKDNKDWSEDEYNNENVYSYIKNMHPHLLNKYEIREVGSLLEIINNDPKLTNIYSKDAFKLKVDNEIFDLESQILRQTRKIIYITNSSNIDLYIKKGILEDSLYPVNNSLYMILLSGDLVTYGDEGRTKQKHIMSHMIYTDVIKSNKSDKRGYYKVNISNILKEYYKYLSKDEVNNLLFTTSDLRDYHYTKQKNNAYYHINAINLPFQNIEFIYINEEDLK